MGNPSGQDKAGIAQSVQESHDVRSHRFFAGETDADTFRSPADRPGLVQEAGDLSAAGEDEFFQRLQVLLTLVDELFESDNMRAIDGRHVGKYPARGGRQQAADVEQLVLYPPELFFQTRRSWNSARDIEGSDDADRCTQLIDRSVRLDAQAVFPDLFSSRQARPSLIPHPGIHFGDSHIVSVPAASFVNDPLYSQLIGSGKTIEFGDLAARYAAEHGVVT
jgi:hypothetical protein